MVELRVDVKVRWWVRPFVKLMVYMYGIGLLREQRARAFVRVACKRGISIKSRQGHGRN